MRAFVIQVGHCCLQPDPTAVLGLDLIEYVAERALLGEAAQLGGEVLLQRLMGALGLALQGRMNTLRDITNQNVRHAYIMLSSPDARRVEVGALLRPVATAETDPPDSFAPRHPARGSAPPVESGPDGARRGRTPDCPA